jgi:TolA-binding protein
MRTCQLDRFAMPKNLLAMAAFIAMLPFGAAAQPMVQSQEGIALENQILQLQAQVQQLQAGGAGGSALGGGGQPAPTDNGGGGNIPSSVLTNLLTQVQQLQSQIQDLNGRVDTLQNQVNTQNAAMEKEIGDIKFAMGNAAPGGAPGTAPGATPGGPAQLPPTGPQNVNPDVVPPQPHNGETAAIPASPKEALHAAQVAILHRDYPAAEAAARGILATAKSSPQGYQAQYILAQSLYGEGKAQDSAIAFDDAYNRDRSGTYAPGSLLGLANALAAIHQEAAACDTLASLNSQFPTPPKGMAGEIAAASKRAHCG